jgi:hypothetical protein
MLESELVNPDAVHSFADTAIKIGLEIVHDWVKIAWC